MGREEKTLEENKEELINIIRNIKDIDFIIYVKKIIVLNLSMRNNISK